MTNLFEDNDFDPILSSNNPPKELLPYFQFQNDVDNLEVNIYGENNYSNFSLEENFTPKIPIFGDTNVSSTTNNKFNSNNQQYDKSTVINGLCKYEDIKQILINLNYCNKTKILEHFQKESIIVQEEREKKFICKKRSIRKKNNIKKILIEKKKIKMGRKTKNDLSIRKHNKFKSDNIMKKIKAKLLKNLVLYINHFIKHSALKLKFLNYSISNIVTKNKELELLGMTIKDILSNSISPKYTSLNSDYNEKAIKQIIELEKDNKVLMFILYLTFREWIDLFISKKNILNYGGLDEECSKEIIENMPKIGKLMENILSKDGATYLSNFIFCLYNYEIWFSSKRNRRPKIN